MQEKLRRDLNENAVFLCSTATLLSGWLELLSEKGKLPETSYSNLDLWDKNIGL